MIRRILRDMSGNKKRPTKELGAEDYVPVRVPRSIRKRVKQLGTAEDKSLQDMAAELLEEALKKRGA